MDLYCQLLWSTDLDFNNVLFFIIEEAYVLILDLQIPFDIFWDYIWLLCNDTKD